MSCLKKRWMTFAIVGLAGALSGQVLSEQIVGRFDRQGNVPVVVADKVYRVNATTQLVDGDNNPVAWDKVHPGRDMRVESAVEIGSSDPVATRITVLEPH